MITPAGKEVVSNSGMQHTVNKGRSKWLMRWGAVAVILLPLGLYFGPQTIRYWQLRPALQRSADTPPRGWSSVPQLLTDTRISTASGTKLSYFGYSVEVPWNNIERERNEGRWADVRFKGGPTVKFDNPAFFNEDPINRSGPLLGMDDFDLAFGPAIGESKYQQFKDVISVKPADLSPLRGRREFARIQVLLEIKGLWFEHNVAAPDIFAVQAKGYPGFEISGLARNWQSVGLHFFDLGANRSYSVFLDEDPRSGAKLDQAEVNRVIQSFAVASSR
jgi:hypothetical protein